MNNNFHINSMLTTLLTENPYPDRGGRTELSSDQTIFESTHVLGALELHDLEKVSSAFLSGQLSGTCLIRGYFGLGRSGQRPFFAWTSTWVPLITSMLTLKNKGVNHNLISHAFVNTIVKLIYLIYSIN